MILKGEGGCMRVYVWMFVGAVVSGEEAHTAAISVEIYQRGQHSLLCGSKLCTPLYTCHTRDTLSFFAYTPQLKNKHFIYLFDRSNAGIC